MAKALGVSSDEIWYWNRQAKRTRRAIPTVKADSRDCLIATQGTTAAFGRCRSLHLTARHAVKKRALMLRGQPS